MCHQRLMMDSQSLSSAELFLGYITWTNFCPTALRSLSWDPQTEQKDSKKCSLDRTTVKGALHFYFCIITLYTMKLFLPFMAILMQDFTYNSVFDRLIQGGEIIASVLWAHRHRYISLHWNVLRDGDVRQTRKLCDKEWLFKSFMANPDTQNTSCAAHVHL